MTIWDLPPATSNQPSVLCDMFTIPWRQFSHLLADTPEQIPIMLQVAPEEEEGEGGAMMEGVGDLLEAGADLEDLNTLQDNLLEKATG